MTLGSDSSCNGRAPPPEPRPARDPQAGSNRTGATCHCDDRRPRPGIEPGSVKPVTHQESMNRTDLFICSQGQSPLRSNGIRPGTDRQTCRPRSTPTRSSSCRSGRSWKSVEGGVGPVAGREPHGPEACLGRVGQDAQPRSCRVRRTAHTSKPRPSLHGRTCSVPATGPTPPSLSRPAVAVAVAVASEVAGQRPALPAGAGCNPAANPILKAAAGSSA